MHEKYKLSFDFSSDIMMWLIVRLFLCFLFTAVRAVNINSICYKLSVNYFDNVYGFGYVPKVVIRIVNCRYIFIQSRSPNE